jgi:hypothetical protein
MGFMPPYRNERYHLASFRGRRGGPRGKLETFNYTLIPTINSRATIRNYEETVPYPGQNEPVRN